MRNKILKQFKQKINKNNMKQNLVVKNIRLTLHLKICRASYIKLV